MITSSLSENSIKNEQKRDFKSILVVFVCLFCSLLTTYLLNNPYGNYIPFVFIAIIEWYRFYPRQKRSFYGLCRLLLYIFVVTSWVVIILKLLIQNLASLCGYKNISIEKVQHLFPYALIFTSFARTQHDMDLNDIRRYIIHFLFDIPAFFLVLIFKLLKNPLNSLCSQITDNCYLGCLPIPSDVKSLNDIGIKYVVNMCAEYRGPCKAYEKYGIEQLHLPTVDSTAPSLKTIEKAVKFMKEIYQKNGKVFVHCKAGMGRSAAVVFCHLVANEHIPPNDAIKLLKEKRPEVSSSLINYTPVKQFLISLKDT